jgi:4-hydroxy-tetrahydrodipicolinate synthase
VQARIFEAMQAGDAATADRLYRDILPLIVFVMQSVDQFLCYGKRLAARRLGLGPVHDRAPGQAPTELGLAILDRLARGLPDLAHGAAAA